MTLQTAQRHAVPARRHDVVVGWAHRIQFGPPPPRRHDQEFDASLTARDARTISTAAVASRWGSARTTSRCGRRIGATRSHGLSRYSIGTAQATTDRVR